MTARPIRFGPYYLDQRLAVGGTAEVYLARPIAAKDEPRRLIVKRLLPHFASDEDGRHMFDREVRLHAAVTHPNVVTVYGSGTNDDGEPYLAMEYVEGVDGYRLLRRLKQEGQAMPVDVAVHIAREVLRGLGSVHDAVDGRGTPLGIIHRDVTPSNIYLGLDGTVKLGDFGIARAAGRATMKNAASAVLKGKFGYLAPEQVAGEDFDHRADLFSMGTVLAEMLLGKPLFPGGGQLAVLLAIRDCRIDALREIAARLPPGLLGVLEKALAREPDARFQRAADFEAALAKFEPDAVASRRHLALLVGLVQGGPSSDAFHAVRESARAMRASSSNPAPPSSTAAVPVPGSAGAPPSADEEDVDTSELFERPTGEYGQLPSYVETSSGARLGPWPFARLIEALATGAIGRGDKVDFMGRGLTDVENIDELRRFLPIATATTNELAGPGKPDWCDEISPGSILSILLLVLEEKASGVLLAERRADDAGEAGRKELYFVDGKLHHVASSNASELLGQYLVRRGKLAREELDLALAVLPRYGGRMGDTLISLGLVGPVDIFRAIRDQGRDRVADLFVWRQGTASFYRGQTAPHVEFPLDLELPGLMISGLEASEPTDAPLERFRARLEHVVAPGPASFKLKSVAWPPLVARLLAAAGAPQTLRELLKATARSAGIGMASKQVRAAVTDTGSFDSVGAGDLLRALEVLLAAKLVVWKS